MDFTAPRRADSNVSTLILISSLAAVVLLKVKVRTVPTSIGPRMSLVSPALALYDPVHLVSRLARTAPLVSDLSREPIGKFFKVR